jgi:hypothetical protein
MIKARKEPGPARERGSIVREEGVMEAGTHAD